MSEGEETQAVPEEMSLHVVAHMGSAKSADVLLESGADVNAVDGSGGTPLHRAVRAQKEEMVTLLLGNGAKPMASWGIAKHPCTMPPKRAALIF